MFLSCFTQDENVDSPGFCTQCGNKYKEMEWKIYLAEKTTNSLYNLVLRMAEVRWPAGVLCGRPKATNPCSSFASVLASCADLCFVCVAVAWHTFGSVPPGSRLFQILDNAFVCVTKISQLGIVRCNTPTFDRLGVVEGFRISIFNVGKHVRLFLFLLCLLFLVFLLLLLFLLFSSSSSSSASSCSFFSFVPSPCCLLLLRPAPRMLYFSTFSQCFAACSRQKRATTHRLCANQFYINLPRGQGVTPTSFCTNIRLHKLAFTQTSLCTHSLLTPTIPIQTSFCTIQFLHALTSTITLSGVSIIKLMLWNIFHLVGSKESMTEATIKQNIFLYKPTTGVQHTGVSTNVKGKNGVYTP